MKRVFRAVIPALLSYANASLSFSQFCRTYGGQGIDQSYGMILTTDGGCAITGVTSSFGAGKEDVYILKFGAAYGYFDRKCKCLVGVEW